MSNSRLLPICRLPSAVEGSTLSLIGCIANSSSPTVQAEQNKAKQLAEARSEKGMLLDKVGMLEGQVRALESDKAAQRHLLQQKQVRSCDHRARYFAYVATSPSSDAVSNARCEIVPSWLLPHEGMQLNGRINIDANYYPCMVGTISSIHRTHWSVNGDLTQTCSVRVEGVAMGLHSRVHCCTRVSESVACRKLTTLSGKKVSPWPRGSK